jgi:putative transposase
MSQTFRTCKIRIYPNTEQEQVLARRMGASRFAWNWCLARWDVEYKAGNKPTPYDIAKLFRAEKPEWFADMDMGIVDRATANLGAAFRNFFAKRTKYPVFKRKGDRDSYQVKSADFRVDDSSIRLRKMTPIKLSRPMFHVGKIIGNVTISRSVGRWYVAIPVEMSDTVPSTRENQAETVGIDLGISSFATLSDGQKIAHPKYLRHAERRLKISQREVSRKVIGSANRKKAVARLARRYATVRHKRQSFLHGITSTLAKTYGCAVIEDLAVSNMMKNRHLAKSISDCGWREFRRQLEYKMPVITVDRFFPSSKTCHACGTINQGLKLSDRIWTCECGSTHDRDVNAALNLKLRATRSEVTPISPQGDMTPACKEHQGRNHSEISNA